MNDFQENIADTAERTLAEHHRSRTHHNRQQKTMRNPEMHLRIRPFVDAALERGVRTRDLS
jgi:hypothetical protein